MTQNLILSQLKQLAEQNAEVSALWLYGSRARDDHSSDSDYDFAVSFYSRASTPIEAGLRPENLRVTWQEQLDRGIVLSIVDIDRIPTPLAVNVIDDGILLLDKTPKETAWLYQKIWSKWEDWQYLKKA